MSRFDFNISEIWLVHESEFFQSNGDTFERLKGKNFDPSGGTPIGGAAAVSSLFPVSLNSGASDSELDSSPQVAPRVRPPWLDQSDPLPPWGVPQGPGGSGVPQRDPPPGLGLFFFSAKHH